MVYTQIVRKEIKSIVKEGLREVLNTEFMKLRAALLPLVSGKEQKDIEHRYKKPSRKVAKRYVTEL